MKPIRFSKVLGQSRTLRSLRLALAAPALVLTLSAAQAGTPTPATAPAPAAPAPASNWVSFTIGGAFVSGDDAGMMQRTQTNGDFYGGIDSMQFSQELNKTTTLTIDGHVLPGLEDYEFNLDLTKTDLGYFKAGYKQFRTWYDGSGGFVPGVPGGWVELYDDELSVDRGELSFEAGLRMENLPEITFGYTHDWRNGAKDSTSWGRSSTIYPPGSVTGASYAIVPTLYNIDEMRDTYTLDVAHTLGNTDLALGLRYETVRNTDALNVRRDPLSVTSPRTNIQTNVSNSDMFSGHISSQTRLNERMLLSFGYAYSTADTDSDNSSRYAKTGNAAATLVSDLGTGNVTTHTANANFWWSPIDDLVVVPSFRASWEDLDMNNYSVQTGLFRQSNDSNFDELTEQIEVRYTGLEDLTLYSRAEFSQNDGEYTLLSSNGNLRLQESDVTEDKFVAGANWYPMQGLTLAAQYYYTDYNQDYDNSYTPVPPATNAFDAQLKQHDYDTNDMNVRATWRALPNLTLVSRYDYQQTSMDNQTYLNDAKDPVNLTTKIESAYITRHIFSESATWMPVNRAYVQGTISYVLAQTDTPADTQSPAYVADSDNDYLTGSLTVGYAIDDKTDISSTLTYYGASDYSAVNYTSDAVNVGFGPGAYGYNTQEFAVSVTLRRMLTENMMWNLRYGFMTSNTDSPDQTGGNNDFDAHMISTGLQIRF